MTVKVDFICEESGCDLDQMIVVDNDVFLLAADDLFELFEELTGEAWHIKPMLIKWLMIKNKSSNFPHFILFFCFPDKTRITF